MIDRGGEKILPQGVEEVLAAHPAVADAAVFAVAHPTLGEDVAAAVVLREGASATALELRRFAATQLAAFKVPRPDEFLDQIPRTSTGKAQRSLLAERFRKPASSLLLKTSAEARLAGSGQLGETRHRNFVIWLALQCIVEVDACSSVIPGREVYHSSLRVCRCVLGLGFRR